MMSVCNRGISSNAIIRRTMRGTMLAAPSHNLRSTSSASGAATQRRSRVLTLAVVSKSAAPPKFVKVVLQGRKLEVTDAIKAYVEDKVSKACEHFTQVVKEVDVSLSARGGDTGTHGKKAQKVEVTIYTMRNGVVRVEDTESNLYAAIDLVCDKIERKLTKLKALAVARGKWPGRAGPHEPEIEEQEFQEYLQEVKYETQVFKETEALNKQFAELNQEFPALVRRSKKVELDLMTVDEAIDAMEAVGHDFFVFREMESDSMQVIYRRQSDGYGILVPSNRD